MAGFGGAVKLTGESEYRNALKKITQNLKEVSSELKLVSSQYDKNDKSEEAVAEKTKVLNKQLSEQISRVENLRKEEQRLAEEYKKQTKAHDDLLKVYEQEKKKLNDIKSELGESSDEYKAQKKVVDNLAVAVEKSTKAQDANEKTMSDLRIELNKAEAAANKTAKEIDALGDDAEESGKQAEKSSEGYTVLKNVVANLASAAIAKAVDGLKELGAKFVDVAKQAYNSFATYEQLVGGVETLFKDAAPVVQKYAQEAYKTAGISANDYMQQVTSFSATLLQGLNGDTKKAAEYANKAIQDMSDNANKFGTDISSIQNAYQGFAKDNYTMLDNLKLGYGGTASEMARLVKDSGVLGESVEVTANSVKDIPFSTIIEAIHKIQENIGVTGTTAKEASETIEGSGKAVSASWENLLTAVGTGKRESEEAAKTLVANIETYLKNAVPVVKRIIKNLWSSALDIIDDYAPMISDVLRGVVDVVKGLFDFIGDNWEIIVSALSAIAAGFVAFKVASLIEAAVTAIGGFITALKTADGAMEALNMTASANPFLLLASAMTAVVAAITALGISQLRKSIEEYKTSQSELVTAALEVADSFREERDAAAELAETEIAQVENIEKNLLPELEDLVDANGDVKEGEEARAQYILGELNRALGTEYDDLSDIVDANGKIKDSIYDVITAKKAQIYLDAYADTYAKALKEQETAYQNVAEAASKLGAQQSKIQDLKNEFRQMGIEAGRTGQDLEKYVDFQMEFGFGMKEINQNLADLQNDYNKAVEAAGMYSEQVQRYDNATNAVLKGNNQEAIELLSIYGSAFKTSVSVQGLAADEQQRILGEQATRMEAAYQIMVRNHKATWETMTEQEKEEAKKAEETAKKRADSAAEEFRKVGGKMIQGMTNGVADGSYKFSREMQKSVDDAVNAAASVSAYSVGYNLASSLANGYDAASSSFLAKIESSSNYAKYKMEQIWGIGSPSKYMRRIGKYIVQGEVLGVEDEKRHLNDALRGLGRDSQAALVSGMTSQTAMRTSAKQNEVGMVDAFKEALSEMKIELDDRVAGKFVERTVARAIY